MVERGDNMIHSVIDIGSNSIRLSVYKIKKDKVINLFNDKVMAGLGGYIVDGELSEKGIQRLVSALRYHKTIIDNFEDIKDVSVFATASLRNATNYTEIMERVGSETGYPIGLLSEKEEALYSFLGATRSYDSKRGVLTDIGGGSTEIVYFKDKKIDFSTSVNIGSLNLYHKFVERLIPIKSERKEMEKYIIKKLEKLGLPKREEEILCIVGGTGRAALKLYNEWYEIDPNNRIMDSKKFFDIVKEFENMNIRNIMNTLLAVKPDRIHTLVPGMIILNQVRKVCNAPWISVSQTGVREGFIYHNIVGRK